VSPGKGRKGKSGKGRSGGAPAAPSNPQAARRRAAAGFGALFGALFVVVAVSVGVGDPGVPAGDVAFVEDAPGGNGEIGKADFEHALEQAAAQAGQKKVPKPGEEQYEELKSAAIKVAIEPIWLEGLAEEMGVSVSEKEVEAELAKLKKENFKTKAEYQKFLKEAHFTPEDVLSRVRVQKLSTALQAKLKEQVPKPSSDEIKSYYEAAKSTQFTQKAGRDVRVVVNKDKQKAEEAHEALLKNDTAQNWEKVAKKYSEDATTKETGGLKRAATEESFEEPLAALVFSTPEGQVEGPVKTGQGYTVFEVENSTPESVQELKTVESQIKSTLAQRLEQEHFATFVGDFNVRWRGRTFCAPGYVVESCANFKPSGHPSTAPEGCYEANPKGGLPEACPAPVVQLKPAEPGTNTVLAPQGEAATIEARPAQRPRPAGEGKEEGAEGAATIPGAVPPTEEAPPPEG
jgi:parvulin-like peptidyl-prolyl isomerase